MKVRPVNESAGRLRYLETEEIDALLAAGPTWISGGACSPCSRPMRSQARSAPYRSTGRFTHASSPATVRLIPFPQPRDVGLAVVHEVEPPRLAAKVDAVASSGHLALLPLGRRQLASGCCFRNGDQVIDHADKLENSFGL